MGLIIAIKDHFGIAGEGSSECFPEGFEASVVGDDVAVVPPEVMGIYNGVDAFGICDVVYD